jgi:excisionase family DNA binding protein
VRKESIGDYMADLKTGVTKISLQGTERATMSIKEAARVLGVGKNLMYAAVRVGDVPVVKIGSRLLVSRAILEGILSGEQVTSPSRQAAFKVTA